MPTLNSSHYDHWIGQAAAAGFRANGYAISNTDLARVIPAIKEHHQNQSPFWALIYAYLNGRAVTLAQSQGQNAYQNFGHWFSQAVTEWAANSKPPAGQRLPQPFTPAETAELLPILPTAMADGYAAEGEAKSPEECKPIAQYLVDGKNPAPPHFSALKAYFGARAAAINVRTGADTPETNSLTSFRLSVQKFLNEWERTRPEDPCRQ